MFNVQKSCNLTNLTFKKTLQVPLVSLYSVVGPAASMFLRKSLLDLQKAVPIFFKRHPGQCFTIKTYVMVNSTNCKKNNIDPAYRSEDIRVGAFRNMAQYGHSPLCQS